MLYARRFTREAIQAVLLRTVLSNSDWPMPIGRRRWVILAVPAGVSFLVPVGRLRDCRIEGLLVEDLPVRSCLDPLGQLLLREKQVPQASLGLFAERAVTVWRAKEAPSGVEGEMQKGLFGGLELGESVGDESGCAGHAPRRRLLQSAMREAPSTSPRG